MRDNLSCWIKSYSLHWLQLKSHINLGTPIITLKWFSFQISKENCMCRVEKSKEFKCITANIDDAPICRCRGRKVLRISFFYFVKSRRHYVDIYQDIQHEVSGRYKWVVSRYKSWAIYVYYLLTSSAYFVFSSWIYVI